MINHLDLFSGIGGFALAAQMVGGIETVGFCEIDPWARKVLNKNFPGVPIHEDVKTLDPNNYGRIDLITGGYPCQPFSNAGKRRGEDDDRHLWPEICRLIERFRPRYGLFENVVGHVSMGLDTVLADLERIGYSAKAAIIPAIAVGADHRRDRVWIMAYSTSERLEGGEIERQSQFRVAPLVEDPFRPVSISQALRKSDGIPRRMDRIRGLGNAIVPAVAAEILRCMISVDLSPKQP